MKRHLLISTALLLGSAAGTALAGTPRQPVQDVYPDSTYEEIQQAIDTGGTVYFHRLTKQTNEYGEYNQLATDTPDVPPSTPDDVMNKGFMVGRYRNDVDIIGVLGPDGERPRINGGMVPFRVNTFPHIGVLTVPVNFKIENLEILNPDMYLPHTLYSRIGIWVTEIAAQSTINNCKITVTGKETDPGHADSFNVAIWFYGQDGPSFHAPPSGARIDITNNTIAGDMVHDGIHVRNVWPETPGIAGPQVFISNNVLDLRRLGGSPNGRGTGGATLAVGINVTGNFPGPIVTNNVITGDGRSPGLMPRIESIAIRVGGVTPASHIADATVVGNDSSSFNGAFQLWVEPIVSSSTVARNLFGGGDMAGVRSGGGDGWFLNNHFLGVYPGWEASAAGPGLFWFTDASHGNTVQATKLNGPPYGLDICQQVRDDSGGANTTRGAGRCRER